MTARTEWIKTHANIMGEWDLAAEYSVQNLVDRMNDTYVIKRTFNNIFRRLVTSSQYARVKTEMTGEEWTPAKVYAATKRRAEGMNVWTISGITFILLSEEEYAVYIHISAAHHKRLKDRALRIELMKQPRNQEESKRLRIQREDAWAVWNGEKKGEQVGETYIDYSQMFAGAEWKKFFTEVFPTYEDRLSVESINKWVQQAGLYPMADESRGVFASRIKGGGEPMAIGDMWSQYKEWCKTSGYKPKYVKQFSVYLEGMGFRRRFVGGKRQFEVYVRDGEWSGEMTFLPKEEDDVWLLGVTDAETESGELFVGYNLWGRSVFIRGWKKKGGNGRFGGRRCGV